MAIDPTEISYDHVPPKNLFPQKNAPGVLKLSTHEGCNRNFGKDEEYFLYVMTAASSSWESQKENPATKKWEEKVKPYFATSEHGERVKKMLANQLTPLEQEYSEVPESLKSLSGLKIDASRVQPVLLKIVRGLVFRSDYRRLEDIYGPNFGCQIEFWPLQTFSDPEFVREVAGCTILPERIGTAGNEEFKYFHLENTWWFEIFGHNVWEIRLNKAC
ncbi:hypothetical protein MYX75_08205 [Acidobacteria bacterium AH-259-A15]|nr:hypothetical protein [Acidobacteria bacterium AH-259-A15]